jgi:hypothetical protein
VDNPYFLADQPITAAAHFTRRTSDLYLVHSPRCIYGGRCPQVDRSGRGSGQQRKDRPGSEGRRHRSGRRCLAGVGGRTSARHESGIARAAGDNDSPGGIFRTRARVFFLGFERPGQSAASDGSAVRKRRHRRHVREHGRAHVQGTAR